MTIILAAILAALGTEAEATARALAAGIEQRIDHCRNLKFDIEVEMHGRMSSDADRTSISGLLLDGNDVVARDTFKIIESSRSDVSVPCTFWGRRMRGEDGGWGLHRFVGFDGAQRREFLRKPTGEGRWHQGNIVPFDDRSSYGMNLFERFILADINGLLQREDPTHAVSHAFTNTLRVTGSKEFHGRKVYSLESRNDSASIRSKIDVIGAPDFLVVRSEAMGAKDGRRFLLVNVSELREFEGRAYPAAGVFQQSAYGLVPEIDYRFRLASIERLPESAREQWFPDWPPGTVGVDQVNNRNFSTPHDPRELEKQRLIGLGSLASAGSSGQKLFFLIFNVCGIVLLVILVRRARRRRAAARPARSDAP